MEKKKLLLIAVSLGIFLVIVIGLSILIFAPKKNNTTAYTPVSTGTTYTDAAGAASDTSANNLAAAAANPITLPDSNAYTDNPVRSGGAMTNSGGVTVAVAPPAVSVQTAPSVSTTSTADSSPELSAKTMPAPATATSIRPASSVSTAAQSSTAAAKTTSGSSAVRTGTVQNAASAPARQAQPVSSAPAASASAKRNYESYWVQAGAFSTQIRAEDVKETLKTKGLAAVIETYNLQGKDFYRVRVGPYTSRNEADYWLALIKGIQGFEESQIWQNNAVR
jgi:DedD protein